MIKHPGGMDQTKKLIELAGLIPPARILDLGAGDGETVRLLSECGFIAAGIDKEPGPGVEYGDLLHTPYRDGSFDAVISECALFISGEREQGLKEAWRLLSKGGKLLYADVWFVTEEEIYLLLQTCGFQHISLTDVTQKWQEYYIQSIWDGTVVMPDCDIPRKKCRYYLIAGEKK